MFAISHPFRLKRRSPVNWAGPGRRVPVAPAADALGELSGAQAAAMLSELPVRQAGRLLASQPDGRIADWLRQLPPKAVAGVLAPLPAERRRRILAALPACGAAAIDAHLAYPPNSAGRIMDRRFIAVREDTTVAQCLAALRSGARQRSDEVLYIYVIDADQRLVGIVSLRELVFAAPEQRLRNIMNREVRRLRVQEDQEEVARRIQHYRLLGLPVVDEQERLVGVVKIRDAIRVAQAEATEDMHLMVGLSGDERIWTPWRQSIARRLPWLGVNLGTALGAAAVVSFFEGTVARWSALVAFLPLICAVAGNAGNQSLTVIIRSLALGEVAAGDARRALRKELIIGALNGIALACAIGGLAYLWKGSSLLALVAGTAMLANQVLGALAGVAVPLGLRRCGVDPALASSIFVTALTDTIGFLVFLGLATWVMATWGL